MKPEICPELLWKYNDEFCKDCSLAEECKEHEWEWEYLHLDLDLLYEEGYYYTKYDICGAGHSITIQAKDKDAFLDEFVKIWRKLVESSLKKQDW